MDGEILTLGDVCTLCFLAAYFLVTAFFAWVDSQNDFLVVGGEHGRDSKMDVNPLISGLFQYESELSPPNCRWHLLGILGSLLYNSIDPNLSTNATKLFLLLLVV